MNALQDPTKKPSINSLLNPQESLAHPVGTNHGHNQSSQTSSMFQYGSVPSYHLRAASWDPVDDPHKRRPLNGAHSVDRQYSTLPPTPSPNYGDAHASRLMVRSRIDESSIYTGEGQVWQPKHSHQQQHQQQQHQHAVSGMSYPTVLYSDERTAGDYQSQSNYPSSTYGDQPTSSSNQQSWQQSERVSLRLAARGTVLEPQQPTSHDARYAVSSYHTHPNIYSPVYSAHSTQQLQPLPPQLVVPETTQTHLDSASRLSSSSTTSSSSKRPLQEDEFTLAPKAKRAKAKSKSATPGSTLASGSSKRGYNAKKRSEAALITAQNENALQRATASNETSSNDPASSATNTSTDLNNGLSVALVPELQYARCMSNRYKGEQFSRCVSCTRRWAGDTCRFQGIRYLLRGPDKKVSCISFREHHIQTVDPPVMHFPTVWNRKFKKEHVTRTKLSIAKALLPTLKLEREHLKAEELVRRPRESEVRATCDTCMTSLFSASWMCRVCGREVCHECYLQVKELTSEPPSASQAELAALQGKREKHAHSNPFFLSCNKRTEHGVAAFTAVTRFWDEELNTAIEEMEDILRRVEVEGGEDVENNERYGRYGNDPNSSPLSSPPHSDPVDVDVTAVVYDSYRPSNLSSRVANIPVHRIQQIPASLYDPVPSRPSSPSHANYSSSSPSASLPPSFSSLWTLGVPILVKDVLPRFKLTWTPEYFIQQYGDQSCLVIECQTDINKRVSVREFFEQFGKYEGRTACWKLKDWPPSTDFKSTFPELFEDFSQAVPVPDYVRRDGVLNLGSHFPSNTIAPDLGPKMYNSLASSQEPGSKGSTRLHMDMADALNVMLYASKCEDGTEGYAVWDLFKAEDSDKLRVFLKKFGQPKSSGQGLPGMGGGGGSGGVVIAHDPIHGQQFYLDVEMRQALFEEYGVKSYRVYQRPGDGVFIPAGCAHQVANMSDCMKVASDFVSPENIDRCEKLTKEFREQNQSKVWKEDVLQLRTMMCSALTHAMTKPTFMQSLLNQPSQSYSHPVQSKQDMLRTTASDTNRQQQMPPPTSSQQLKLPPPTAYRRTLSYNEFEDLEPSEDSDLEDLFFTPNTSPRTSMASSLLMFPTGRKPSRRSLRLSDASDIVLLADVASAAAAARPSSSPVLSTRTPFSSTQNRQHPRHIHTLSTASTNSLEPHSVLSDHERSVEPIHTNTSPTPPTTEVDDKKQGKGVTKRTRHGLVTIKPSPTTTTTNITQTESVKSTTTSKRMNSQQGLAADGDVKRSTPSSSPPPVATASKRKSSQQGVVDGDVTKDVKRSESIPTSSAPTSSKSNGSAVAVKFTNTTTPTTTVGPPRDPTSRKSSKSQTPANPAPAASSASSKEKMKQDVVVAETEKGKQVDSSTPSSSKLRKDRGKETKAKTTPAQTTLIPKTTPHTFSAFAPLVTPSLTPPANESTNESSNNKPSLPPAGFSFPPPPPHSPQRQTQTQQQKNSLNGSAAAYTYALRQKGNSSPKPGGTIGSNGIWMSALLEEDEVDVEGDGNNPARRLRRVPNGGNGQKKGKEKRISDSTSSRSESSSHHSYSVSPSRSNAISHPTSNSNTTTPSQQSQSHSDSSTFRGPPKTLTSEVNAMSFSTPGERPSKATQGYSSLVLPRAPLPHSGSIRTASTSGSGSRKWFGGVGTEGKIDLTRSGVAQTTMASVEVVRGLGRQQGQNRLGGKLMGMLRRRSTSGGRRPRPIEGLGKPVDDARIVNENLSTKGKAPTTAGVEGTVLGFTSYRKPPGYVPSSSVLVQVWAVGIDGVDGRLVGVNFGDHVWREWGGSGYEDEETGVETEWERKAEESEDVDVSRSTPQQGSSFSGLGRSLSLKMSRTKKRGSIGPSQQDNNQARGRTPSTTEQKISRSFSLKRNSTVQSSSSQPSQQSILIKSSSQKQARRQKMLQKVTHRADVGYIPGRSFVGRVLECGWEVKDEEVRKGEWVVGLLDIKKCGALTEFIVVDRHRIHRVPHPRNSPHEQSNGHHSNMGPEISFQDDEDDMSVLTLEELALLPLCGIPAYRAVRTFIYAFSSLGEGGGMASPIAVHDRNRSMNNSKMTTTEHPQGRRRRVLVLRGHDGVGAMAVQILAKRGWEVSVHVPFSATSTTYDPTTTEAEHVDPFPKNIQERARDWGADEIIFDEEAGDGIDDGRIAAIRVMESLRDDGDVFDAILDTVGGKEVREAGERLLRSAGVVATTPSVNEPPMSPRVRGDNKAKGVGQFTTLVGDVPERPIPTTADLFRAGMRSFGVDSGGRNGDEGTTADMKGNKVGYAWVSVAQDVDWEGEDISETLSSVLRLALEERVRPVIGARYRIVPFEQAPYVFVDKGPLGHGCNVVVKIAG